MPPLPLPGELPPLIVLGTATTCYLAFHYLGSARSWAARLGPATDQATTVHLQRASGVILLGLLPALVGWLTLGLSPLALGLGVPSPGISVAFVASVVGVCLPLVRWNAGKSKDWDTYPEIRTASWTRSLKCANAASWAVYLLAYEFFFRGFFLVPLVAWAGVWPAIAIMTAFYVAVHLSQPAGEAVGTLPMGVVFAGVALGSGAIWACWIGHVLIAVGNDHWVVQSNPALVND